MRHPPDDRSTFCFFGGAHARHVAPFDEEGIPLELWDIREGYESIVDYLARCVRHKRCVVTLGDDFHNARNRRFIAASPVEWMPDLDMRILASAIDDDTTPVVKMIGRNDGGFTNIYRHFGCEVASPVFAGVVNGVWLSCIGWVPSRAKWSQLFAECEKKRNGFRPSILCCIVGVNGQLDNPTSLFQMSVDSLPRNSYDMIVIGGHDRAVEIDKRVFVVGSMRTYDYGLGDTKHYMLTASFRPPSKLLWGKRLITLPKSRFVTVRTFRRDNNKCLVYDHNCKTVFPGHGHLRGMYVRVLNDASFTAEEIKGLAGECRSLSILGSEGQMSFRFERPSLDEEAKRYSQKSYARGFDADTIEETHREVVQSGLHRRREHAKA